VATGQKTIEAHVTEVLTRMPAAGTCAVATCC